VRHARDDALDSLEPVLVQLRQLPELTERSRGTFYRKSQAFVHFHEDPAGLFADVRLAPGDAFTRLRVTTKAEQRSFTSAVRSALAG
jgi:hypothetical protein